MQTNALEKTQNAAVVATDVSAAAVEAAVGMGDFSRLSPADRVRYLAATCQSLGLNPLTLPIQIMKIDGKEVMYARAECAAQLRARDKVSIKIIERTLDREHGCFVVVAVAQTPDGRQYEASGLVSVFAPEKLKEWRNGQSVYVANPNAGKEMTGQDYANARKKAETQATRRATLGLCGLGIPDESDVTEIEEVKAAPRGELLPGGETVADIAAKLNAGLTKVEKETAIEATPIQTTAPKSEPIVAEAAQILEPAPLLPQPPQPDELSEDEKTWRNVETVVSENPNSIPYLRSQKKLAEGASLRTLDMTYAGKILQHPKRFIEAVEAWAKGKK